MADKVEDALLELADILELAVTKIRTTLKGTGVTETRGQPTYDVAKIHWEERKGESGLFEIAEKTKNAQSPDYAALDAHLQGKEKGCFTVGLFYWRFPNGDAIGRKKTSRQGTQ